MKYKIEESTPMIYVNEKGQTVIYKVVTAVCPCCGRVIESKEVAVGILTPEQEKQVEQRRKVIEEMRNRFSELFY